jgi:hypothetical protein
MAAATIRCSGNSSDMGGVQGRARTTLSIAVIFMDRIIGGALLLYYSSCV